MDKTSGGYLHDAASVALAGVTVAFAIWSVGAISQCRETPEMNPRRISTTLSGPKRSSLPGVKRSSLPRPRAKNDVLCPCLFSRFTTSELLFAMATTCAMCFAASALFFCSTYVLVLAICSKPISEKKFPISATVSMVISWAFGSLAYILMFVIHFERLRLTFKDTSNRLPQWAPNLLYAAVALGFVMLTATIGFMTTNAPLLAAACLIFIVFLYLLLATALIHAFFTRTMRVADSTDTDTSNLTECALRVTICATTCVLSTTVTWTIAGIVLVAAPNKAWARLCRTLLLVIDVCLNCFCLLCTFRKANGYYRAVCNGLHMRFLSHLSD